MLREASTLILGTPLGIAAFGGLWIGIIGRHNNDPD